MDLANRHIKLLKRLYHSEIPLSDFSDVDRENLAFLGNYGYIRYSTEDTDLRNALTIVRIQPSGQAAYDSYIRDRRRWYIPVVLSVIAIAISLFALYKSGQEINVYVNANKMNAVTAENPPANADNK